MALRAKLLVKVADLVTTTLRKITVVGAGAVGMAIVSTLLGNNLTNEICLVDKKDKLLQGEILDLRHGAVRLRNAKITTCTDYACSENSDLFIITPGVSMKPGESRLDLLAANAKIIKEIVPQILKYSPNTLLFLVTNPVDVLTYVAWKVSGLPVNRVVGSGTTLDSFRLRSFLAKRIKVAPSSIEATVIGEHGGSSVPCWSTVTVGNARLTEVYPDFAKKNDTDKWFELKEQVINAATDIIALKGNTTWGIAYCSVYIARCILNNTLEITPVTTNVKGFHGICDDVFLSLPCLLGKNGVQSIITQCLSSEEEQDLLKSADLLLKAQKATGV